VYDVILKIRFNREGGNVNTRCSLLDRKRGVIPVPGRIPAFVFSLGLSVVSLFSHQAEAAGMEEVRVNSLLGQPLQAEIQIAASKEELAGMTARLADPEHFSQTGLNYSSAHARFRLSLEKTANGATIVIRSTEPVNEPYLDLLVELNWQSGRLMRGYTVLLDPPEVATQTIYQPTTVSSAPVEPPVSTPSEPSVSAPPEPVALQTAPEQPAQPEPVAIAPQQQSAPPAPSFEASGKGHVVKKGEYLHRIAAANLEPGVTLEQMLVALYRNNQEAFIGNNMNRLRQGAILRIPSGAEAAVLPQAEARQVFRTQSASWNAYQRKLASIAGETSAGSGTRSASGSIGAQVDVGQSATKGDQVRVSRSDLSQGAAGISEEDAIAQEKRLQESKERVAALEKIVSDLRELLRMKEQGLSELQKQLKQPSGNPSGKQGGKPSASLEERFPGKQYVGLRDFSIIDAYRVAT
jgi:pilus assembly protein FimV